MKAMFTRDWRGAVAAIAVTLFILTSVTAPLVDGRHSQLSAYDNDWNDISIFRRDIETLSFLPIEVSTVSATSASLVSIDDARNMLYMAIGVERPYTFAEWRAIRTFMRRGGTVLVADDFGHGNSLLRFNGFDENPAINHLGDTVLTQYKFSGKRMSDVRVDRNPQLVRLTVPVWEGLQYEVLLNDPSCFVWNDDWSGYEPWQEPWRRSDAASILANSSESAWLDDDRDGIRDPGEKVGEFPVVMVQDGLFLVADPSIFTNDMYWRADNRLFVHAVLTRLLPRGGTVIIDESIHIEPGLFSEMDDIIVRPLTVIFGEDWPIYSMIVILLLSLASAAVGWRRPLKAWSRHKDRLDEPRRLEFGNPYNWLADYYEVRGILLQRMRYAYGLDPDELQRLPPELVAQLLGDEYLVQFVLQPVRVDPEALNAALADISRWEPPPQGEALVLKAERYLASLPLGAPAAWSPPQWGQVAHQQAPPTGSAYGAGWTQNRGGGPR
jgi:hypothetical protein